MNHLTPIQRVRDHRGGKRRGSRPLVVALAVAATLSVAALTGCSATSPESIVAEPDSKAPSSEQSSSSADTPIDLAAFNYTGKVETVKVPSDVYSAHVTVVGGSGGGAAKHHNYDSGEDDPWGYGAHIAGDLKVTPGSTLTIAVGGAGQPANGNSSPGAGGWSLNDHYGGGRGGSGYGSQTKDGSGGGGASVIQVDGETRVVAGGGGGTGGHNTKAGMDMYGGNAGQASGEDALGDHDSNGKGGSSTHPGLDQAGHTASGGLLEGGGGGGGGGRYTGGGGMPYAGGLGGGGGGGGSSLVDALTGWEKVLSGGGNGSITINWRGMTPSDQLITVAKTGTPDVNGEMLEIPGGRLVPGTVADVSSVALTGPDPEDIADFQKWTYHPINDQGFGQLINKQTGLCLEVNGSTGAIDQWECTMENNHLWSLVSGSSGETSLRVNLDRPMGSHPGGTNYLATATPSGQVRPGTQLTLTDERVDAAAWSLKSFSN